jgi:hypothetical protein
MTEFIAALTGAIIGGLIAVYGGFLAQDRMNNNQTRGIARALLIELQHSISPKEYENSTNFFVSILDDFIKTGEIKDDSILGKILDQSHAERYPIYHANAQSVGLLPEDVCASVVRLHSLSNALVTGGQILLKSDLSPDQVRAAAKSLKDQYYELLDQRSEAISALELHVSGLALTLARSARSPKLIHSRQ